MQKHRMMLVISALSLASLAVGPIAMARESEARDDRGGRHEVQLNDDRGQMQAELELRNGADDPAGDDRGIDAQPHARGGADNPAGDDRGGNDDPKPHA